MLSPAQRRVFHDEGYFVLPGAVPEAAVRRARRAINHSLGEEGMAKDDLPRMRSQSYCGELRSDAAITDLVTRTSVWTAVESLMGEGAVQPPKGGQIALRFPSAPGTDPGVPRGHLDGLGSGANGMERGVYTRGFTGLAVVLLCDLPEPFSGNFTVWPGTHRFFETHFREHGHEILGDGMPRVDLPTEPVQITGRRGDVVITHHQLVHTAAPNASDDIRYAAIFRLRHVEIEAVGFDAFTDIWREWAGVRDAMAEVADA
jgi:hypothetical protein